MIINLRGTSGSGKSTIVRELMSRFPIKAKHFEPGRKQPIGYTYYSGKTVKPIPPMAVIGHYETACGGCDTISKQSKIFELVRLSHKQGFNVIFEGLLLSAEVNNTAQLHLDGLPLIVLALDQVPVEECLDGVNERRLRRLGDKYTPVNPKNTVAKMGGVTKSMARLKAQGVEVVSCSREGALDRALEEFELL